MEPRLVEAQAAFEEATKLEGAGKHTEALAAAERALALRRAVLGEMHPQVADCAQLAGGAAMLAGELARAEPLLSRALAIREAVLGKSHIEVASSLHLLGNLYFFQGMYSRAEPLYQRALAIRETALGKDHPDVAISLNNLGATCYAQGLYDRAEAFHRRALAIRETLPGEHQQYVAQSLNNLANVYADQGMYGRAEPLYHRALTIQESTLGKDHLDVSSSLNNLAILYQEQGLYDRAELSQKRALAIKESALGKNDPGVAQSLNNLASLYGEQGLYDRAEPLQRRALSIFEATLGKDHPDVAMALRNLASDYTARGQYDRAEPLAQRALAIRESALGKDHPEVASSLTELAELSFEQGRYDRAAELHQRALAIRESALGKSHPEVARSLNGLARVRLAQHRVADALPLFTRALTISEGRLRQEALDFSESRLTGLLDLLRLDEEHLYALLRAHPDDVGVRRLALTAALLLKGRSAEETANISHTIYRSLGPEDREAFERLRGLRTQLATLSLDGPGELSFPDYQQRLRGLTDQSDALEAELGKRSARLRALSALPSPADIVDRVAASLPPDAALVELLAYSDRPLVPRPGTPKSKVRDQPRYLAVVLVPDGSTRVLDLGPAAPIDAAAVRLRDALAEQDAAFQGAAQKLYQLAFKPVLPFLGNTRRLFLAPDGQLALVPFAALHDGRHFLADTFDFTYLGGGKDLLSRPGEVPSSPSVAIFADPDYGASSRPAQASTPDGSAALAPAERSYPVERFFTAHRAGLPDAKQDWASLPGTRQEAEAIQHLLPHARVFLGAEASKERLLRLSTPGILHIATHGFFLGDAGAPGGRGLAEVGAVGGSRPGPRDPLLRSGLVLAGAPSDPSNSLVTALELSGLNLWGTELVVLSACDSGRGDLKRGQGVYGLRRALIVAGAETLVVSLWKVDDETTRTMMERYYRNLLAGQGRATALREAMLSLRAQHPHPHFWAPFIAVGRDAPLKAFARPSP